MNWGYKLMFTFIVFAGMIGYMVYRCFGTNFELVEPEYYKSELKYQQVIDGTRHADSLSAAPSITQSGNNLELQLPVEMKNASVSGSILFYCAYDSRKDRKILLSVDESGRQSLNHQVMPGNYTVKMQWHTGDKNYYSEKIITIL